MRFLLFVWLVLWLVLAKFCCPETKIVYLASFLGEKKDSLQDDWTFLWRKNLKIQYHCPWKSQPAVFSLSVCILCIFWPNFIALSLKTFFWQAFKGIPPSSKFTQESPWETWWSSCPGGWRTSSVGRGTPPKFNINIHAG
jgi:hypothetical protein